MIFVQRFLCLACQRTASILPDEAHPRRWYAGAAILAALVLSLLQDASATRIRADLGCTSGSRGWRSLQRWRRQFLDSLWFWKAAELGHSGGLGVAVPASSARLLRLFLNHLGATDPCPPDECAATARAAVIGTVHDWPERALISRIACGSCLDSEPQVAQTLAPQRRSAA